MKIARYNERCIDCIHCDAENLLCHPESVDCNSEYMLSEEDLYVKEPCDFFEPKEERK